MIRINLLPREEGVQSVEQRRQLRVAYAVLGANVAAALVMSLLFGTLASRRESQLESIRTEVDQVMKVVKDVQDVERQRGTLQEKRRVIAELEHKASGPLRILVTLSDAAPQRLWLSEFTDRSGEVTITGLAIDDPTVAEFLSRLQRSPHFHGLELVETAQALEGQTRVKKFVMRGPLDYSGAVNGNGNGSGNGNGRHTNGKRGPRTGESS
jgi:type IV pilus assembly protein PilN